MKLTPERHARIVKLLRAGNYREVAAQAAGVGASTLRAWVAKGRRGEEPYASLVADIDQAEAEVEVGNVATILSIGRGKPGGQSDWRAIAWWLEKRHRSRYGQHVTINVEEAKDQLLSAVSAVCSRHPDGEAIFNAILDELDGGNAALEEAGRAPAGDVH